MVDDGKFNPEPEAETDWQQAAIEAANSKVDGELAPDMEALGEAIKHLKEPGQRRLLTKVLMNLDPQTWDEGKIAFQEAVATGDPDKILRAAISNAAILRAMLSDDGERYVKVVVTAINKNTKSNEDEAKGELVGKLSESEIEAIVKIQYDLRAADLIELNETPLNYFEKSSIEETESALDLLTFHTTPMHRILNDPNVAAAEVNLRRLTRNVFLALRNAGAKSYNIVDGADFDEKLHRASKYLTQKTDSPVLDGKCVGIAKSNGILLNNKVINRPYVTLYKYEAPESTPPQG
jgi:hypothetical protein